METTQSFSNKFAENLTALQPQESSVKWDIRGEIGDMQLYDKTLIAIVNFNESTEELYGNRTQRLTGSVTGQIFTEQMANGEVYEVLDEFQAVAYDYIGALRYTEIGDAVVLQGTCDSILSTPKGNYWNFILPIDLVVQF